MLRKPDNKNRIEVNTGDNELRGKLVVPKDATIIRDEPGIVYQVRGKKSGAYFFKTPPSLKKEDYRAIENLRLEADLAAIDVNANEPALKSVTLVTNDGLKEDAA